MSEEHLKLFVWG